MSGRREWRVSMWWRTLPRGVRAKHSPFQKLAETSNNVEICK